MSKGRHPSGDGAEPLLEGVAGLVRAEAGSAAVDVTQDEEGAGSLRLLPPETGAARLGYRPCPGAAATVVVLTGRAEFIEKYAEIVADLQARGNAVAVVEWRGQGLSLRDHPLRARGHIDDFTQFLDDLRSAMARLEAAAAPRPWVMLAHSMGGHVGLRWLRHEGGFAGAVMTAPMLGIRLPPAVSEELAVQLCGGALRLGLARTYAPGQHDFRVQRFRFARNRLTSCRARFKRLRRLLREQPELALGGVTWGWLDAGFRSMALLRSPGFAEAIDVPVVVCVAGDELIVSNPRIEEFARRLPQGRLLPFAGARHELLQEVDPIRDAVLAAVEALVREVAG